MCRTVTTPPIDRLQLTCSAAVGWAGIAPLSPTPTATSPEHLNIRAALHNRATPTPREACNKLLLHKRRRLVFFEHQNQARNSPWQAGGGRRRRNYKMKYLFSLTALTVVAATPSATMRFMEHVHGSERGSSTSPTQDSLYGKRRGDGTISGLAGGGIRPRLCVPTETQLTRCTPRQTERGEGGRCVYG